VADEHPQIERDAKARREVARAAGIALITMSAALEEGLIVGPGAGATTLVLVAFAARARRLLRSAYRLIDAGEQDTAMPLLRVMNEYLIVSHWLLEVEEDDLKVWAIDDLHRRLTVLREVNADPQVHHDVKDTLVQEIERTEAAITTYGGDDLPNEPAEVCPECKRPIKRGGRPRPPTLEQMARVAGLGFAYSYPFRILLSGTSGQGGARSSASEPDRRSQQGQLRLTVVADGREASSEAELEDQNDRRTRGSRPSIPVRAGLRRTDRRPHALDRGA
jgi:hypothetical protein